MHKRFLFGAALAVIAATPVLAAGGSVLDDAGLSGANRYQRCLSLSQKNANSAYVAASAWEKAGGGAAATHCAALALVALRRYGEAALKLDAMARDPKSGDAGRRATLFDQAGNAWLLGKQAANAHTVFSAALQLAPGDPDLLTDRARASAMAKNWAAAEADLSKALSSAPSNVEILVLRASARHAQGKKDAAMNDVNRALQLEPRNANALLERGNMKYDDGDNIGSVADWEAAVAASPNSSAGKAAQRRVNDLNNAAAKK